MAAFTIWLILNTCICDISPSYFYIFIQKCTIHDFSCQPLLSEFAMIYYLCANENHNKLTSLKFTFKKKILCNRLFENSKNLDQKYFKNTQKF